MPLTGRGTKRHRFKCRWRGGQRPLAFLSTRRLRVLLAAVSYRPLVMAGLGPGFAMAFIFRNPQPRRMARRTSSVFEDSALCRNFR